MGEAGVGLGPGDGQTTRGGQIGPAGPAGQLEVGAIDSVDPADIRVIARSTGSTLCNPIASDMQVGTVGTIRRSLSGRCRMPGQELMFMMCY